MLEFRIESQPFQEAESQPSLYAGVHFLSTQIAVVDFRDGIIRPVLIGEVACRHQTLQNWCIETTRQFCQIPFFVH